MENGLDALCWDGAACRLSVVVNDLKQVMFGILEDDEDAFVLEDYLHGMNDIRVRQFSAQSHFSDSGLRDASILNFALFIRLEPKDG